LIKLTRTTRAKAIGNEEDMSATSDDAFRRSLDELRATDLSALRAALADAMRLQVLKRMQGTLRHDFVSPLQATGLTFDLLRRQLQLASSEQQRQHLAPLIDAGKAELDRFKSAISNVVDGLALSDRDQRFDLRKALEELRAWMQNEAAFLGLQLEVSGTDELWINSRREDVRQLIAIVMLFTIDALSSGGKLTAYAETDGDATKVRLVAEGMKEPARWGPQMFEPNWSEPRLLDGVGLFVARLMIADLGGAIDVEVPDPQHAEFRLRIPRAP
jgi:C4-dicarboxylate-specific signal transduction histidine kinase